MGKTAKWFRGLLGLNKKPIDTSSPQPGYSPAPKSSKKKWSFVKSYKEKDHYYETSGVYPNDTVGDDPNKHAIAVAAATAAVAEAAVAAAHAAAAVVRLTSSGRATTTSTPATSALSENATIDGGSGGGPAGSVNSWMHIRRNGANYGSREVRAAIMIQSHFRAYLSRRALRALKALVKLQALVRGHIIRKQTADMIRRMQALLRVQARARAGRSHIFDSPLSVSKYTISDPSTPTPEKFKRNGSRKGISDKIVEIDTGKGGTHSTVKRRSLFHSSHLSLGSEHYSHSFTDSTAHQSIQSPTSHSFVDYFTADSSPFKKGLYTPAKSDTSGCSDQPNYMSVTESSRAKIQMRSMSAPKQRINNYDRSNSMKRYSIHGFNVQKVSNLHDNFTNKAYPGSGRLDRLGLPVGEDGGVIGYSGGFSGEQWHRY